MEQSILRAETTNQVFLRGELMELPVYSHENHGKQFDKFVLSIQRLSGARDKINVLAEHEKILELDPTAGTLIEVQGEIRSYNNRTGQGRRLVITVYAHSIAASDGEPDNQVLLRGTVCREPVYRRTPLGREICDVMLAVERKYRRMDYLPCVLWGSLARMAADCEKGTELSLTGRIQSRTYLKQLEEGSEERTAYEISAITAEITELSENEA